MVRDRVVRGFMRANGDWCFSGVLDAYFSGSMLFMTDDNGNAMLQGFLSKL